MIEFHMIAFLLAVNIVLSPSRIACFPPNALVPTFYFMRKIHACVRKDARWKRFQHSSSYCHINPGTEILQYSREWWTIPLPVLNPTGSDHFAASFLSLTRAMPSPRAVRSFRLYSRADLQQMPKIYGYKLHNEGLQLLRRMRMTRATWREMLVEATKERHLQKADIQRRKGE